MTKEQITSETTLHLYVTSNCTNHCPLCCNREYPVDQIPIVSPEELRTVNTLCITGGEPLLYPGKVRSLIEDISIECWKSKWTNLKNQKVYIYTSGRELVPKVSQDFIGFASGFSIGPKSYKDWKVVEVLLRESCMSAYKNNRLYIFPEWERVYKEFEEIYLAELTRSFEVIHRGWQKKFEPAQNSVFRRLPVLFSASDKL